jgi:hypothetical protein
VLQYVVLKLLEVLKCLVAPGINKIAREFLKSTNNSGDDGPVQSFDRPFFLDCHLIGMEIIYEM